MAMGVIEGKAGLIPSGVGGQINNMCVGPHCDSERLSQQRALEFSREYGGRCYSLWLFHGSS